ncbi:hypothetical protein GIB67_042785 [Kingdonia uniflora]|uniref:Uncharacterized protein n=1 Tax=Kingdonia uniflora TaxID=39325 RepID=A0A7J7L0Y6_9MAGN|nr:hypothetical protein GIB67_042785 [Kingdonia uniflora]
MQFSRFAIPLEGKISKEIRWGQQKVVLLVLYTATGKVALSAFDELAINFVCSNKALENAKQNQAIVNVVMEPISRGPWYKASIIASHKRDCAS